MHYPEPAVRPDNATYDRTTPQQPQSHWPVRPPETSASLRRGSLDWLHRQLRKQHPKQEVAPKGSSKRWPARHGRHCHWAAAPWRWLGNRLSQLCWRCSGCPVVKQHACCGSSSGCPARASNHHAPGRHRRNNHCAERVHVCSTRKHLER